MRNSRHKKNNKHIPLIIIAVLLVMGVVTYGLISRQYSDHFLPKTVINDTDISGLTIAQANQKLKGNADQQELTIADNQNVWKKIKKTDLGLKTDYASSLKKVKDSQNQWKWGMSYVFAADNDSLDGTAIDQAKLDQKAEELKNELDQLNTTRTKTENATLVQGDDGFTVKAEVAGNSVDVAKVVEDIKKSVTDKVDTVDLKDYTEKPTIKSDDKALNEEKDKLNKIAQVKANYSINGETFQIPTATVSSWLQYKDGKITIDQDKVVGYVNELGTKYNTSTNPTKFKSTKRGEVEVPAGTYSWTIQPNDEAAALSKQILAGEDFTRSPIVAGSANASSPLIGDTYIEVDLQNQHMWYYSGGQVKLETDIVSGKPKTPTPPGVDYVWKKSRNETLKGLNDDGSKYASPVSYWMPIDWSGVGIHDSDWQPAYGGELWKTVGSHGCINTPPETMAKLYDMVAEGTPVLVF